MSGKTSGSGALVRVGLGAVFERAHQRRIARPGMLGGHVVEHEVDTQRHPGRAQVVGERAQIVHGAQRRLHRSVVDHRVATVVGGRPGGEQRHQVQVGDAQLAQVGEPLAQAGERPGEAVGVSDVTNRLFALQPVGGDLTLMIEHAQLA